MAQTEKKGKEGEIWAVGGGKGGTGKTFITSGLGTSLARNGRRVILVDMDIGGAGLHSFIGLDRPARSLASFFETGAALSDLSVGTEIDSMSLVAGDIRGLSTEGNAFSRKLKLFREQMKRDAQNVLIDLGAGSRGNALDAFLIADKMIIVISPEITAIENMYHFIKSALFRQVKKALEEYGLKEIVPYIWDRRERYGVHSIKNLIDYIKDAYPYFGTVLERELRSFRIHLVLNMVRNSADIQLGPAIKSVLMKYLGVPVHFSGYVEYNDAVWMSVRDRTPFMKSCLSTRTAGEIEALVENIALDRDVTVTGGLA
ncbi:MAG: MinD/ParA family ATP-binding protein [Candidatus Aminicenantales bacterium]